MVNLADIKKTNKIYTDTENELLFIAVFKDKKLNSKQRSLDIILGNKLSQAMEVEGFIGKEETKLLVKWRSYL